MTPRLHELLDIGEGPLVPACKWDRLGEHFLAEWSGATELAAMLSTKNGFYAFGSALLVRPLAHGGTPLGIVEWNAPALWRYEYEGHLDGLLCFAEDIFGGQFALGRSAVVVVDPETGQAAEVAGTLEGWADAVLADTSYRTGYPLARDWQRRHGRLRVGYRLVPRVPFVTGGEFSVENLYAISDAEGMRFRGSIARQIREVPDGGHVVFEKKPASES